MLLKRWCSNLKLEYWKDVQDYESLYMVSTLGRVKSLNYRRTGKEKILKPRINNNGYLQVNLCKNGKVKMFLVHRLVAIAFIPNVDNKPEVNHIDENKQNNNVNNLEWMTSKENCNWGTRNKKASKAMKGKYTGEKHPGAKKVKCVETGEIFDCIKYACEWCGLKSHTSIVACCQGKQKSAGKHPVTNTPLHWEYIEEVEVNLNLDLNILTSNYINISI